MVSRYASQPHCLPRLCVQDSLGANLLAQVAEWVSVEIVDSGSQLYSAGTFMTSMLHCN